METINIPAVFPYEYEYEKLAASKDVGEIRAFCSRTLTEINDRIKLIYKLWGLVDPQTISDKTKINWKNYRFIDTLEICAQETERVTNCLQSIPAKELIGGEPLMVLEQKYGLWQDYISDDSDDEDWQETSLTWGCGHETDEDEIQSESEEDLEIIE